MIAVRAGLVGLTVAVSAAAVLSSAAPATPAPSEPARPLILYTGRTQGLLNSCSCKGHEFGDLSRQATVVKHFREAAPELLAVDAGNVLGVHDAPVSARVLAAYTAMGYDAVALGRSELRYFAWEKAEEKYRRDIPWVAANLVDAEGRPLFATHISKKVAEKGILVTAFIPAAWSNYLPDRLGWRILPPEEARERFLKEPLAAADAVILLDPGLGAGGAAAAELVGAALTVRSTERTASCDLSSRAPWADSGPNPQFIGLVRLDQGTDRMVAADNHFLPIGACIALDEKLSAEVFTEKQKAAEIAFATMGRGTPSSCGECHKSIYAAWKEYPHARAYETLKAKGRENDPVCLSCHTTGAFQEKGFRSLEATPELAGVGCQTCHPLREECRPTMDRKVIVPDEKVCLSCHDTQHSPRFNYRRYVARLACYNRSKE